MFTDQVGSAAAKRVRTQEYVSDFDSEDNSNVSIEGNVRTTQPGSNFGTDADGQMYFSSCSGSMQQVGIAQRKVSGFSITSEQILSLIEQLSELGLGAHNYFAIGFHCGLLAEDLMDLEYSRLEQEAVCLKETLAACGSRLSVSAVKAALRNHFVLGQGADGYDALVSTWAAEHGVAPDGTLSDDQHRAFIDYLVSYPFLQRKWWPLGCNLGIHCDELAIIKADVEQGLSTFQRLRDVLELGSSKNIDAVIKSLSGPSGYPPYEPALAEKIAEWADSLGLENQAISQLSKEQFDQLLTHLRPVSPYWDFLGLKLGIHCDTLDELRARLTTKPDWQTKCRLVFERARSRGLLTGRNLVDAVHKLRPDISSRLAQQLQIEAAKDDSACVHWQILLDDYRQHRALTPSSIYQLLNKYRGSESIRLLIHSVQENSGGHNIEKLLMIYLLTASQNNTLSLPQIAGWLAMLAGSSLPEEVRAFASQNQQPDTESKPVEVHDIASLLAPLSTTEAIETTLKVAALLGVPLQWNIISQDFYRTETPVIWEKVLATLPCLQTGHLKQLFRRFHELQGQDILLPVKGEPTVALKGVSTHAHNVLELACQLENNPELLMEATRKLLATPTASRCLSLLSSYLPSLYQLLILVSEDSQSRKQLNAVIDSYVVKVSGETKAGHGEIPRLPVDEYLPDHFMCPLSLMPMENPVLVRMNSGKDIRYFEKSMLLRALSENAVNPLTREPLTVETVRNTPVDTTFRGKIVQWLSEHPNYQDI